MNEAPYKPEPLKLNPVWFMRTTPATYLRKIVKLRKQHTVNFTNGKWLANQTIDHKIRETWDAFRQLSTRFRSHGDVCFFCGAKTASPVITGQVPGVDAEYEVFCSQDHCGQFGIVKGQT